VRNISTRLVVLTACGLFLALGMLLIPLAGIQNDEALFGNPIYLLNAKQFYIRAFHRNIPLMVMSYVGTLKTLVYLPILHFFGANVWAVRLPVVLCGALTVFFFYHLANRSAGVLTGLIGAWLLASDPSFLITDTYDWGPVAIEHLLLVTGCFFLVRFGQASVSKRVLMPDLALGFFFLGLAVWNKAIFGWALAGLAAGALAVFWRIVCRAIHLKTVTVAAAAFLFGAAPFVVYNLRNRNATGANARLETEHFRLKLQMAGDTLNGASLFGFIAPVESERSKSPAPGIGRLPIWIRDHLGEHRQQGMAWAFLLSLAAVPWWWRSRAARFSLVFIAVTWTIMALTRGAGGAAHHAVLLWPFPQLFVAVTLASIPWARIAAGVAGLLVVMNLLVVNQYFVDLERNGAEGAFTDAIFPLSDAIPEWQPLMVADWGMLHTLALLHQGRVRMRPVDDVFSTDTPDQREQKVIEEVLADSDAIWVGHVEGREFTAGARGRIVKAVESAGYRKEVTRIIADSNGRPVFEIYRIAR
jgi:Dolichyl-phosphate-mannose-protein mannosyltransferase